MHGKGLQGLERRQYIRLDSVFPVQFQLLSRDGKHLLSEWLQGFTNNIGKGGICLTVNNLDAASAKVLKEQQARLLLQIEVPFSINPVAAQARVVWIKEAVASSDKYLIGLSYEEINPLQNKRIMRYAWAKKLFVPLASSIIIILGLAFAVNSVISAKLIRGNKALVGQLVRIAQESSVAKQKIKEISREREDLQIKIQALQQRIQIAEEQRLRSESKSRGLEIARGPKRIEELDNLIGRLAKEKGSLQEQLIAVQRQENTITEELLRLDKRKVMLEKANLEKMYQWLKVHQNDRTGLVMSFEGDSDIANRAFIYDQSLVAQAYTNFSDFERAKKIFDFFNKKAKKSGRQFFNAYYCSNGSPAGHIVQSGPNIWLGIAILHYTQKTQDTSYLSLAEEVARGIMDLQAAGQDGGIRGGPDVNWYSPEHNLGAYAFFSMLYKITGQPQYQAVADKVLNWLIKYVYNNKMDLLVKRSIGDSTIATDTYAWSIAAIGPQKLGEIGLNPDRIMEFAEQNCSAEVSYTRPEGTAVKIKGFDFSGQGSLGRDRVISSERTAQMVIAFKVMSDFYYKKNMIAKARTYALKADEYLSGLSNMVISSPSPSGQGESCLVYATQDSVDTGQGWFAPKGKTTGSVAGTVYALFAYYSYNPLNLQE